ncbi:hypothetical protein ACLOJK_017665 [Asimina triloba]
MPHGAPFTPGNSNSGSLQSDMSGSAVLSEEIDSGPDSTFYAVGSGTSLVGESTEPRDHLDENMIARNELRLHEINTLDWDDLLVTDDDINSSVSGKGEGLSLDRQMANDLKDAGSNSFIPSQNGCQCVMFNGSGIVDQNPHQSLLETRTGIDSEMVSSRTRNTLDSANQDFLETQDSFGRWMNYIVNDPPHGVCDMSFEDLTSTLHESGSCVTPEGPKLFSPQEPLFTISDISPAWSFSTEQTKMSDAGKIIISENLKLNYDRDFPPEMVQVGVFRCMAPPHTPGLVNFYLTLDENRPISQVLSFEYRSVPSSEMNSGMHLPESDDSKWEALQIQIRLARLLFSTRNITNVLSNKVSPSALRKAKRFSSIMPSYDKKWMNLIESVGSNKESYLDANCGLLELLLKNKFHEWLLEKIAEECKATARDHKGQGVIHLCAMLGYTWAGFPWIFEMLVVGQLYIGQHTVAGNLLYREQMAAFLLSAGANPSLVTDPTRECPGGFTCADLASMKGHDGLAAYLAEKGLVAHFQAMSISGNATGTLPVYSTGSEKLDSLNEEQLCMKETLAAYRNAAEAANRIQNALRENSLKLQKKAVQLAKLESEESIIAALKIQHAYRKYYSRKRMAAAVRIQHRFRTWKVRKDFLNMRRQAIKIQSVFRGHQVRRQYRKILWSVGVLEKAVLRWRQKRKGLRGLQVETPPATVAEEKVQDNDVEEDFYKIGRKHTKDMVERSVIRVQAMFRSYKAQKEYQTMKRAFDQAQIRETKSQIEAKTIRVARGVVLVSENMLNEELERSKEIQWEGENGKSNERRGKLE